MSTLYIRCNRQHAIILHNLSELKDFADNYLPGRKLLIGVYGTLLKDKLFRQPLLKLIEENPAIDVYSPEDIVDPILLSRFSEIKKESAHYNPSNDPAQFDEYPTHLQAVQYLASCSAAQKVIAPLLPKNLRKLLY